MSDAAEWTGAIGQIAATAVTGAIALAAWAAGRQREAKQALAALKIIDLQRTQTEVFLAVLKDRLDPSGQITTVAAQDLLGSGTFREMIALIAEIRPTDLPSTSAAHVYITLRGHIRHIQGTLETTAQRPASAMAVHIDHHEMTLRMVKERIDRERSDLLYPLWPRGLQLYGRTHKPA